MSSQPPAELPKCQCRIAEWQW